MVRKILFSLLALLITTTVRAEETNTAQLVYIIPVEKMIEPALLYVVRRGVDEATRNNADAIILKMDTTGGRVDSAVAIVGALGRSDIPVYTFVEREAISAGAMIALSTPYIYMKPGSVIGDITPISMGMTGSVQDLPEAVEEKMTSYVAAHVRSAAEQGGHDPELAEAMVRRDIEFKVGDIVISDSGKVLTLTNTEAAQLVGEDQHPLLSSGTVDSIDEMLEALDLQQAEQITMEVSAAEKLARLIAGIAPILMMIGLGGIWLEFKTPGFGIFGIAGISCLLLFFFGHHLAGLSGLEDVLLFSLGVILLAIEVFVTPGFGVMGFSGMLLIFVSFVSAMSERLPGHWRPVDFSPDTFSAPLLKVLLSFAGAIVLVVVAGKFLPNTPMFRTLTLSDVVPNAEDDESLLGLEGLSHSDLRPAGSGYFNGRKLDVVSYGDYIPRQTEIRIVEVHGNRIVVEDISHG
ncbi:NfeD family protein [Pontiellaceae bacterium B1224]|nr:NfeD family protein [Pontiellaceae bacterium B1224]